MDPCPQEDQFLDLLEGCLSIATETLVRTHIDSCGRCHQALVELVRGRQAVAEPDAEEPPVVDPGNYRIEGEFARGGMGTILRARDRRLGRFVALKQLWAQDPQAQERLRREALITARLQHPSIVPVYEAGRWPNGELFYAMKLVSGRSLAEVIAETHTLEDRLVLVPHVIAVAEAAAYAHSEGIIHRDLKPANVVIGPFAETVIIDWGLAKVLGESLAVPDERLLPVAHDALTVHGAVMGTPAYMPFEQASGGEVDARADVYAIGAILYHVLAGRPPFEGTLRDIIERVVAVGPPPLEGRQPGVPADLAAIVRKAMARDPGDRYPTARELAQDLQRFQAGRLVGARRYSRRELLVRWLARRRLAVAVAAVLLAILAVTVAVSVRGIRQSRDLATARRDDLILAQARATLPQDPTGALAWIKTYPLAGVAQGKARSLAVEAASRGVARSIKHMLGAPGVKIRFSGDGRFLAGGGRLWDLARGEDHVLSDDYAAMWSAVLFTPSWLLVGGIGQAVRMWNLNTLAQRRIGGEGAAATAGFDLSPDATTLATVSEDGVVHLWDVASGTERRLGIASKDVWYVAYSPDGTRLATVTGDDGTVRVWELGLAPGTHRVLAIGAAAIRALAWLSDGRTLVTSSEDLAVRLTDTGDGTSREIVRGDRFAWDVAVSADGHQVAGGWGDGRVSVTHLPDGETRWLRGHTETVTTVTFSPDGGLLASGSRDHTVRLWELASGSARILRGHEDSVGQVVFSPDGDTLASTSTDGQVRRWPARDASRFVPVPEGSYTTAWHSADGRWFATGTGLGNLYLHDLTTGATRELVGHTQRMGPLAFSPDARWLASGSSDGDVRLWDTAQGAGQLLGNVGASVSGVEVSPDGDTIAVGGITGGTLVVWSTADRQLRWRRSIPAGVGALAFCPDGRSLAVGDLAGELTLWDLATGVPRVLSHGGAIAAVRFSPDGQWLASAELTAIRLTEVSTGHSRLMHGHTKRAQSLVFSPDGRQLASGGEDRLVWLWDVRTGLGRGLAGHEHRVTNLAYSADGTRLASSSAEENKIWLWDTALGIERRILPIPDFRILEFSFSTDRRRLSAFGSRGIRTWDLDPGLEVPASGRIGAWLDAQTDARIGAEDRVE